MATLKEQRAAAEQQLGVHTVFQDATEAKVKLDEVLTELAQFRDKKRDIEAAMEDAEAEVVQTVWTEHADMAVTRLDKLVKVTIQLDPILKGLREKLRGVISEIEGLEYDKTLHESEIKISCARMNELGGHLQYVAALMKNNSE